MVIDHNRKWVLTAAVLVVVAVCLGVTAIMRAGSGAGTVGKSRASVEIEAVVSKSEYGIEVLSVPVDVKSPGLFPANGYLDLQKAMAGITPAVPDYGVEPDLSNVVNLDLFKPLLSPEKTRVLGRNMFVVTPSECVQMFSIYQNNEYQRPERIPSFITTDSMLHTYHIFFDYSLRAVESGPLFDALTRLTEGMLRAAQYDYDTAREEQAKEAARRNIAYFSVARQLLKGTPPADAGASLAKADLARISAHSGEGVSKCVGTLIDFSQFIPRGHYTRSEKLKRYFRTMMWYGSAAFKDDPKSRLTTLQSLMIVRNLRTVKYQGRVLYDYWNTIYEPTVFYVGKADDYTVHDYAQVSDRVFGKSASVDALADDTKAATLRSTIAKLPPSRIKRESESRDYRFMGQRFIPDSRVTEQIGNALYPDYPSGLDVLAAMGSERALEIRRESGLGGYGSYGSALTQMRIELGHTPLHTWQSNLYWGWLWSLKSIIKPVPDGYPAFMRNQAWVDKSLYTALGSWTELRHDTILYSKQPVAECEELGSREEPPLCRGYVEPNLEFWTKLKWLNEYTMEGLDQRKLLDTELKAKFQKMAELIEFCRRVSVKELTNQKLTSEEYDLITSFGSRLGALTASFADDVPNSQVDDDMAVVADVFTSRRPEGAMCLEEGTGRAAAVYVVVPIEGELYLTRGAVFTHYEFSWPASDRLTDEKWQRILRDGMEPPLADWTGSFMVSSGRRFEEY